MGIGPVHTPSHRQAGNPPPLSRQRAQG